jgi:hypothetical protein
MDKECSQPDNKTKKALFIRRLYGFLSVRAYSVIMFGALFCTLAVKFFHSWRTGLVNEYFNWILADIAVLLGIEVILAITCFYQPRRWVLRTAIGLAAAVCTWSIMNAGWITRTGTQILPTVLLPLFRDPLNSLGIIGVNLAKMPVVAVILLAPSAIALTFFLFVFVKPPLPNYNHRFFAGRIIISVLLIIIAVLAHSESSEQKGSSVQVISEGLRYNSQLKAITSLISADSRHSAKIDFANAKRKVPAFDQLKITLSPKLPRINHNVVVVILEGIQYRHTSLYNKQTNLTPHLAALAKQGVEFANPHHKSLVCAFDRPIPFGLSGYCRSCTSRQTLCQHCHDS